jgi:long-chain fatty acid transport protein
MAKRFAIKQLVQLMCVGGVLAVSTNVNATAFQLFEQDGATVGNYHAGRAATASDASTSFYNPAGITRIKNQQLVVGDVFVLSDITYRGTVRVNTLGNAPLNAVSQAGGFSAIPNFHYVAPLSDRVGFGLSLAAPFGLKTDYGRNTALRYAATSTQIRVVDISPALAVNVTKDLSVGLGLDWQRASAQFNLTGGLGFLPGNSDTASSSKGRSIGYGYHLGALYQFMPSTRLGVAYTSQVVHHIRGTSKLVGPIANFFNQGKPVVSTNTNVALTLPANTTVSLYHQVNPKLALMGTVIYTQWSVFKNIRLKNVSTISGLRARNDVTVFIPANYHNSWNASVGADYAVNDKFTFRTGAGYDQSPVDSRYRNVQVPDNSRYALALGGHFQPTKTVGVDLGWTHLFIASKTKVNPPPQPVGDQVVTTDGRVQANADIFGAQLVWNIL